MNAASPAWIDREIAPRLLSAWKSFPAVVLTGARQAGKTSLCCWAVPKADYVTLDIPAKAETARLTPEHFLDSHQILLLEPWHAKTAERVCASDLRGIRAMARDYGKHAFGCRLLCLPHRTRLSGATPDAGVTAMPLGEALHAVLPAP